MERSNTMKEFGELVEKTYKMLTKYPLCDHCLGRLFAKYGLDLSNRERGRALKTILQMYVHRLINTGSIGKEELKTLAENGGEPLNRLYYKLYGEAVKPKRCYICGNKLSHKYFEELADKIRELLEKHNVYRFLIGVSISDETRLKEIEVYRELSLETTESIKNEIKRETGKIIRDKYGLEPDFENPEAVAIIGFETNDIELIVSPILLGGRYWKRGRNISHVPWISRGGARLYPYSIQEFFEESLKELYEAERVVLHASGREDVDARMLGEGRPMVLEIKNPRFRYVDLGLTNDLVKTDLVSAEIHGYVSRARIEYLKGEGSKKAKAYKLLVLSEKPLTREMLVNLKQYFVDKEILQRTPSRILRRKKDLVRKRRVYGVEPVLLHPHVFEVIVYCDGGLYVKELVHGDNGRTTPSFAELLDTRLYPIEIDVFGVETK